MAEEVKLPELGESVTEGVITQWLVEVGDSVEVDQPLVEISTDKVDTEIPSPVAGTLQERRAEVDDTIEVGQVIALVGAGDGASGDGQESASEPDQQAAAATSPAGDGGDEESGADAEAASTEQAEDAADESAQVSADRDEQTGQKQETTAQQPPSDGNASRAQGDGGTSVSAALMSPLVRRVLSEAGLSPDQVRGTGQGGRITREDAERAASEGGEAAQAPTAEGLQRPAAAPSAAAPPSPVVAVTAAAGAPERPEASPTQVDFGGQREVTQDLSRIRKAIARAMTSSLQTTAQLTAAVEVDLTNVMNLRAVAKDRFRAAHGASLSPLPIVARAVCMTIPRHPAANSSIDTDAGTATFHRFVNLGVAVDTDRGLLVPSIKDAQDLSVAGLATRIADLARRTRDRKVQPDELSGSTFTITNTGSRGTLFDTPVLNPPEVAILALCAVEKRPVVVSDAYGDSIAIRWMSYFCLTYDHRMLDGADAARFLQDLKYVVEANDFAPELGV